MKRRQFVEELHRHGCYLLRHGGNHDIYLNPKNGRQTAVPRHTELTNFICTKVRKELGLPKL
jgi:mRNA interferase HicA